MPPPLPVVPPQWPCRLVVALLVCLLTAGCAGNSATADDKRHDGFYGGISGGLTR